MPILFVPKTVQTSIFFEHVTDISPRILILLYYYPVDKELIKVNNKDTRTTFTGVVLVSL